jgi:putative addiction module component (TIGR02574 family)
MATSMKALGIDRLGIEDRLTLVEEIWDSIAADSTAVPLNSEQRQELERRLAAHEANPEDTVPWSEVRESLGKLLGK